MQAKKPYGQMRTGFYHYQVTATTYPIGAGRPTREAAGRSYTGSRSGHELKDAALLLAVRGTADRLHGLQFITARSACPCCGHKGHGKLALNASGQARLRRARDRFARRQAARLS